jgi:TRAP-type C4-dicarboxylate transport system permease small subunit
MNFLSSFRRSLDRLTVVMTALGEVAIAAMMVLITSDVIARFILNYVIDAGAEIVAHYFMVAILYFALGDITRNEGHLSATFFTEWMTQRARTVLEGVIALILCAFMVLLTWRTAVSAIEATRIGELLQASHTNLPLWPSRWILPLGCGTMALYALLIAGDKFSGRSPAKGANPLREAERTSA